MKLLLLKRSVLLAIAMLLTVGLAVIAKPRPVAVGNGPDFDLETLIPRQFGEWKEVPSLSLISVSPDTKEAIDSIYSQTLSRTYVNAAGIRVMLALAYGSRQTTQFKAHRQEVCYSAQGFQIESIDPAIITIGGHPISATRMVAKGANRTEPVTYWFTMGDQVVAGHLQRLLVQLKFALTGEIPDGYLIRVSSLSSDRPSSFAMQETFLLAFFAAMPPRLARRLSGNAI